MFEGRALGTQGMDAAAYHVAQQFEALGLQPAGEEMTYFQTRRRSFALVDAVPELTIEDGGLPLTYRQDFVEYPSFVFNAGQGRGEVRLLALGTLRESGARFGTFSAVEGLELVGDVVLLFSEEDLIHVRYRSCAGILVVADNSTDLRRRHTLSARRRDWAKPILWISESTANRLLSDKGYSVTDIRQADEELGVDEVLDLRTGVVASLEVPGSMHERVPVRHVLGQLPGQAGHIEGAPQADTAKLDHELVVVMAQYDAPPPTPDDARDRRRYPATSDNASGVAVMLEAVRTMNQSGYQPYRSFLFVAYSGEGQEGGEWVYPPDVQRFLEAKRGFSDNFELEALVKLRGLGAEGSDGVVISAGGSLRLADLVERAADQMGVSSRRSGEPIDISIVFEEKELGEKGQEVPEVDLTSDGWEAVSCTPFDTLESVSRDGLEEAGCTLSLALMTLGRERQY
jgi:hypothetical protein